MAFDADLTPLTGSDVVTSREQATLATVGITTVEELVSAIRDNVTSIANALDESVERVREIAARADSCVSPAMRQAFAAPRTRYATGALPPLAKEAS
jgi:predicted RecB family nuclease